MDIVCLDMEGVLVPEIWIAFSNVTGVEGFKRTTRDEPDYNKLMEYRINLLDKHNLGLKEIQDVIAKIDPFPGAREFLDDLRAITQVIVISDTFIQFAMPLMAKLGYPTLFCNELIVKNNRVTGIKMRCSESKKTTVKSLHACGFETIASGDSYNDLGMIQESRAGFLFRTTDTLKKEYPQYPAYETYDELLSGIRSALDKPH